MGESALTSPDGRHVATYKSGALTYHLSDWLGTERKRTNSSGIAVETCTDTPYGMNFLCTGTDISPMHFTGKQKDTETGNDYFGARYLASGTNLGRFMTPDWASDGSPVPYAKLDNPQTLNLYVYLRNNPLNTIDPDGHGPPDTKPPCNKGESSCTSGLKERNKTKTTTTATITVMEQPGQKAWVHLETVTTTETEDADGNVSKTTTKTITDAHYDLSHADAPRFIDGSQRSPGENAFSGYAVGEGEVARAAGSYSNVYDELGSTTRWDGRLRFGAKVVSGTVYALSVGPELAAGKVIGPVLHTFAEKVTHHYLDEDQLGSK